MVEIGERERGTTADVGGRPPRLASFNHISMPVRDVDLACRFWTDVFGAEPVLALPGRFAEVRLAEIILGFSKQAGGWTAPEAEHAHWGFELAPDDLWPTVERLHAFGVPTGEVWTRSGRDALVYFRDPSGNQFEIACWNGLAGVDTLPVGVTGGGDYQTDFVALNYTWDPPAHRPTALGMPGSLRFDHLSLPVRDAAQTCRFWVDVLGAKPGRQPSHMVAIAGIDMSFNAKRQTGWTGWDAEYPHYAFTVEPDAVLAFKARLEAFGVPTSQIWTRNRAEALMYFRDPSGNLYELYCPRGLPDTDRLPRGVSAGGDYAVDLAALNYDWQTNLATPA